MASTTLPNNLPASITSLYGVTSHTLVSKSKKYETEIGDLLTTTDFLPQVKVKRWANDANFSIRFLDAKPATKATVTASGNQIAWAKNGYTLTFYDNGFDEDGGFEFELKLAQKPPVNSITFTIQTKNLVYIYQPPLTAEEIALGCIRPDNVVGSYAVYHVSKRDNEFETGKAFHIYRPWAEDAKGTRVWCDLLIDADAGTATITIPQDFLDNAVYPVIVDPTFGYTSIGASNAGEAGLDYAARAVNVTASAGTLTALKVYVSEVINGSCNTRLALYSDSSNNPGSRLTSVGSVAAQAGAWNTVTFNTAITSGQKWIATSTDTSGVIIKLAYDSGSQYLATLWSGALNDPFGTPDGNFSFGNLSMYATYDPPPPVARRRLTLLGVA